MSINRRAMEMVFDVVFKDAIKEKDGCIEFSSGNKMYVNGKAIGIDHVLHMSIHEGNSYDLSLDDAFELCEIVINRWEKVKEQIIKKKKEGEVTC